ncbi:winged helix-turn-helix domain-containing protein [Nocardioides sp. GY 10113]|uniref:DNA glycosylase AlkZ-like family protein n=1 Tax=Nocardioides sp. GY 10113 TaxID=2569761 RepID=UPI0010A91ECA|nr:crosslink repair DNA glycosylase YcaQ family protein [Nocardioides sp. GY 10113]TIC86729.1 winged helix-turn-helix domain-containing protein [Nocardioides sp. GY 10113]
MGAGPRRLSRAEARQVAVRAQLLDEPRPESLVALVDHLTGLQVDPTAAVAPNVDLVSWSRLGETYAASDLRFALEEERSLAEHVSFVRPMADIGLLLATQDDIVHPRARGWLAANAGFRADVLALLADEGPLTAAVIPDTCQEPWESSGWNDAKNVNRLLDLLCRTGQVAVSGRHGRLRTWDLPERVYPTDLVVPSYDEARAELDRRRLTATGIARERSAANGEELGTGGLGVRCVVDGLGGEWFADPDALDALDDPGEPFLGRTALLSPFDRLVYDRARSLELFGYEYVLEMYKPAAKRRWGYFALPILAGDRLIGKLDAKADRKAGVLRVHAVHQDEPWSPSVADGVDAEIEALADWLGLAVTRSTHRSR